MSYKHNIKNIEKYEKRLQQEIFSKSSCMSNAKWQYLFDTINALDCGYRIQVKFLLEDELFHFPWLPTADSYIDDLYLDMGNITLQLKEIEYLFFTRFYSYQTETHRPPTVIEYDITRLVDCLQTGKKIHYRLTADGVFIYGYQ